MSTPPPKQTTPPAATTAFPAAPIDRYAARVTHAIAYLGGVLVLPMLFAILSNTRWLGLVIPTALALPIALWLTLAYVMQPVEYIIAPEGLVIRRRLWRALRIPYDKVFGVSLAPTLAEVPRIGVRFAFNAGIFGYQGPFALEPYGKVFFIATNRHRLVSIARFGDQPLIISPENPAAFVEHYMKLKRRAPYQEALEETSIRSNGHHPERIISITRGK